KRPAAPWRWKTVPKDGPARRWTLSAEIAPGPRITKARNIRISAPRARLKPALKEPVLAKNQGVSRDQAVRGDVSSDWAAEGLAAIEHQRVGGAREHASQPALMHQAEQQAGGDEREPMEAWLGFLKAARRERLVQIAAEDQLLGDRHDQREP